MEVYKLICEIEALTDTKCDIPVGTAKWGQPLNDYLCSVAPPHLELPRMGGTDEIRKIEAIRDYLKQQQELITLSLGLTRDARIPKHATMLHYPAGYHCALERRGKDPYWVLRPDKGLRAWIKRTFGV